MNRDITFSKAAIIHASKESVWKVLLSPRLYDIAWAAEVKTTWQPGSSIQFRGVWENVEYFDKGVVQINETNAFLKYSYWSSFWDAPDTPDEYCFISYTVNPVTQHSCELVITQDGFRDEKHYSHTTGLLTSTLDLIKLESEKFYMASLCDSVFNNLISLVDEAPYEQYNQPKLGKWNVAQLVEHIIIGNSGLKEFLGAASFSSARYDSNIHNIRALMLNQSDKLKAPDVLIPSSQNYDKNQHRDLLVAMQLEIKDCIQILDFGKRCESVAMPPFGDMSVFEWLTFSLFHISRHTSQIQLLLNR